MGKRPYAVNDVAKEMVHWWAKMSEYALVGKLTGSPNVDPYLKATCGECFSFGTDKLTVMLYYAQGISVAKNHEPMFKEDMLALPAVSKDKIYIDSDSFHKDFARFTKGLGFPMADDLDSEAWDYLHGKSNLMKGYDPFAIQKEDKELIHAVVFELRKERDTRIVKERLPYEKVFMETLNQTYENYRHGKHGAAINLEHLGEDFNRRMKKHLEEDEKSEKMRDEVVKKEERSSAMEQQKDNVNHPSHYAEQGKVECIDFIGSIVNKYPGIIAGDLQNVTKYTWRSHGKNGKEDIEKAQWYFNHADKVLGSLDKDTRKELEKTSERMQRALLPSGKTLRDMEEIQKQGIEEVTKNMPMEEKALYQKIIGGVNHFYDPKAREDTKEALKQWARQYDRFQSQDKKQEVVVNMKRPNTKGLER